MNFFAPFASAALLAITAVTVACSGTPDGVVIDREGEPQVSPAPMTPAEQLTVRQISTASPPAVTCWDYRCSGLSGTEECRQLCHDSLAQCVVPDNGLPGHCYVP
jgi:hypothetical protein